MKNIFYFILFSFSSIISMAQSVETKTVLFLIPFYSDTFNEEEIANIITCDDIYNISSFELIGFWEGAQMALQEFEEQQVKLKIIVKDITNDEEKLLQILNDKELMEEVSLIIGPFFGNTFTKAATIAAKYRIPIVNPFTSRRDFVEDNQYVFKVMPPSSARPRFLCEHFLPTYPNYQIIIWTDTTHKTKEYNAYKKYFTDHQIPYKLVLLNKDNLIKSFHADKQNIIIATFDSQAQVINQFRLLAHNDFGALVTFFIPDSWISIGDIDVEYFNKMNVHYFTPYYVDYSQDRTVFFITNFIEKFQSFPEISRFSYQGYDITKYFIELMIHDFDSSKVDFTPLALGFDFYKYEHGGFENQKVRLLQIKDYKIEEVK